MSFLTPEILSGANWRALESAVARLVAHCGWRDVQLIGGSGDRGADILAVRDSPSGPQTFLIQVKAKTASYYVTPRHIDEAIKAQSHYKTKIAVVATNANFTNSAKNRQNELNKSGFNVLLWNGKFLTDLLEDHGEYSLSQKKLRPYQENITKKIIEDFGSGNGKSLFVVATGLGKTVIAATAVDKMIQCGTKRVLVLCHSVDLARQLQIEFWGQLSKRIPTGIFLDGRRPVSINGVNFGLFQTLVGNLSGLDRDAFDLIVVDEAHHALARDFLACLTHFTPRYLVGMTATPWRGDRASISDVFGEPVERISLIDGMRMGYLAQVDYRLMCDNVDWERISHLSKSTLSIRDLNKKLFLPQRDEAIIKTILNVFRKVANPRMAVFTSSRKHAEEFALHLNAYGISCVNLSVNDRFMRRKYLMDFASGALSAVTSVDVLNEGIDVPEVNILVFLRATHSRRIFVQQLGRGLRLSPDKKKVIVLDFVSDIRRIAAAMDLDDEARSRRTHMPEKVYLRNGVVTFNSDREQKFVNAWVRDVSNLQDASEAEKLKFPEDIPL